MFHPKRKVTFYFHLNLNGNSYNRNLVLKYLGILIDLNLSWKPQVTHTAKKINRRVGTLSKLCHYVNIDILTNFY